MSMTQVAPAIISLIAENSVTIPGIISIVLWLILEICASKGMWRDRDFYKIIYVLLLLLLEVFVLMALPTITEFLLMIKSKVMG